MSRYSACICVILIILFSSCKKDLLHWQKVQQLSSNTTSRLNKIRFINDSVCIIAGGVKWEKSEMLRSTDGGYTWTNSSSSDARKGMYGLSVAPDGIIYLSGADSYILFSKDTGKTWESRSLYDWLPYTSCAFPTNDTGILINTTVQELSTITQIDTAFRIIEKKDFKFGLNEIYMLSPSTGYAIGYGVVMKTTDHRRTWQFQDATGDNFLCMDIHGDDLWICGENGGIYHSTNGGIHWQRMRNGNDITQVRYRLNSIVFKDKMNGWAVGEAGVVIRTRDGGSHWSEYDNFTGNTLHSIVVCPNGDLLVAGDNGALFRIVP